MVLPRAQAQAPEGDQGFTLIELLVVMVILGILAAISVPTFISQKKKAVDASLRSDLVNAAMAVEATYGDTAYPIASWPDFRMAGVGGYTWYDSTTVVTSSSQGTATPITDARISPGNVVVYYHYAGLPWCLFAENKKASKANDGVKWIVYNSDKGGVQPGDPATWAQCSP